MKPSDGCKTVKKGTPVPFLFHRVLASVQLPEVPLPVLRPATVPAIRILSDASLRHPALVGYLASRGIVLSVAAAFCREVRYEVQDHTFFAVGFRNDAEGWELRSARFKGGSSPKHITTIDNRSVTVIAFEGFMDFLAYLSLKHPERLRIDAAVLNSVVNLPKAVPFLSRHPVIHTFSTTTRQDARQQPI